MRKYGESKRLELWWPLYRTSLPVWDIKNFWPMDFCWHECTSKHYYAGNFIFPPWYIHNISSTHTYIRCIDSLSLSLSLSIYIPILQLSACLQPFLKLFTIVYYDVFFLTCGTPQSVYVCNTFLTSPSNIVLINSWWSKATKVCSYTKRKNISCIRRTVSDLLLD